MHIYFNMYTLYLLQLICLCIFVDAWIFVTFSHKNCAGFTHEYIYTRKIHDTHSETSKQVTYAKSTY